MKFKFSIAALLLLTLFTCVSIRVWQEAMPLDHFEIDVSGTLSEFLPPETQLRFLRNPDYRATVECELQVSELPAALPIDFSQTGCVVEFWAPNGQGTEQRLFSVVVDREMFDTFRVVNLKLDEPSPELKPEYEFWANQAWSAKISQRMRYRELPWMDTTDKTLAPIPDPPEMIVTRKKSGQVLERCELRKQKCELDYYFGVFAEDEYPAIEDGEELLFLVTYESGIFEPITSEFHFRFNEKRHKFW